MSERDLTKRAALLLCITLSVAAIASAAYKAKPWTVRAVESYPARLTSEGVTIAVEPLFRDALAGQVFDKTDIVTRGIMPLAIVIFNDNDFPVEVDSNSIELIQGDDHIRTLVPADVVQRVFHKSGKGVWLPQGIPNPTQGGDKSNSDALEDFDHKFLEAKIIAPHSKGGGFLYLRIPGSGDLAAYLSEARLYIPDVYRQDTGNKMIFFEIELKPAIDGAPAK